MNASSSCPGQTALLQFKVGRGRESEAAAVEAHLADCPQCVETLHGLDETDTLVDAMRAQSTRKTPLPIDDAVTRLMIVLKGWQPDLSSAAENDDATLHIDFLTAPEQPGELGRLGSYRVLKILGVGGMGIVFEAEDTKLRRPVALKVLRPHLAASNKARKRFLREARAAAALTHDNVVTIYNVGDEQGVPFLAMQYLAGETLDARLRRDGALPLADIVRIGRELALGLSAAHAQGLLHRDVKPANIWLEESTGRVKLLDFGLAWIADADPLTDHGAVIGTPSYMAPEQARGEPSDLRADLFSLGSVLNAMCTGQAPFQGDSNLATLEKVRTEMPRPIAEFNRAIPNWLIDVVATLHAKKPTARYPSADAVVARLQGGQPTAAGRLQAARGSRWWRVAAALLLLPMVGITLCEAMGVTHLRDTFANLQAQPAAPTFVETGKQEEPKSPAVQPQLAQPAEPVPTVYPAALFVFELGPSSLVGRSTAAPRRLSEKSGDGP